jgi:hypothetical protein
MVFSLWIIKRLSMSGFLFSAISGQQSAFSYQQRPRVNEDDQYVGCALRTIPWYEQPGAAVPHFFRV